jgi:purine-binding chemotaxis protein CheW
MEAFQTSTAERREMISFRVSEQEFCVDIGVVREIRGWSPATPIPQSPDYVAGVINLRGTVMPIIDLRRRLGFETVEPSTRNVIIVAQPRDQPVGLVVDSVCETFMLNTEELQAPPRLGQEVGAQFLSAIAAMEGRLMAVLNLDAIVPSEVEITEQAA